MSVEVKICGIKTKEAALAAIEGGASYIGLVFFPPSPRNIGLKAARELRDFCQGKTKTVALFVNPTNDELDAVINEVDPDYIQLHGKETPERAEEIKERTQKPIIKALSISTAQDAKQADLFDDIADIVLFDAKPPSDAPSELPGGNGIAFDWKLIANLGQTRPFMLSGGLNPDNVGEALKRTNAKGLDVSSGVERERGEKDPDLIRRFLKSAHNSP